MTLEAGDCKALGSRLREIEDLDALYNDVLDFLISDWVFEGYYYTITYPASVHLSRTKPMMQSYEKVGSEYYSVSFDSIILQTNGDFKVRVLSDPDLRFNGRIIIDE